MQFMPGTFRAYGVDGNGDGSEDPGEHSRAHSGGEQE
jgi:membrane-bound lytic murein transglycosylase B